MKNEKYLKDKIKQVTSTEVKEIFEEFGRDINYYDQDDVQYSDFENDNYKIESGIDQYGGEGQGDSIWTVSRVLDKKTREVFFIRFDGYYESWNGSDWSREDWSIVEPQEVKVIQWF